MRNQNKLKSESLKTSWGKTQITLRLPVWCILLPENSFNIKICLHKPKIYDATCLQQSGSCAEEILNTWTQPAEYFRETPPFKQSWRSNILIINKRVWCLNLHVQWLTTSFGGHYSALNTVICKSGDVLDKSNTFRAHLKKAFYSDRYVFLSYYEMKCD